MTSRYEEVATANSVYDVMLSALIAVTRLLIPGGDMVCGIQPTFRSRPGFRHLDMSSEKVLVMVPSDDSCMAAVKLILSFSPSTPIDIIYSSAVTLLFTFVTGICCCYR